MLPPLTYTIVRDYENCPLKVYHRYILKDQPFEESPELKWGNEVHSHVEMRVKRGYALPPEMIHWEPLFAALEPRRPEAEQKLGMTWAGRPSEYWGQPNSGKPWFRGKVDCTMQQGEAVVLLDWKTGKVREDKNELMAQAMLLKANHPEVRKVTGRLVFLHRDKFQLGEVHDVSDPALYHQKAVQTFSDMTQGLWPAKPNRLCDWCTVKTCKFNPGHE